MSLKELIQMLVNDAGAMMNFQAGQLQLAGVSVTEHKALMDVLSDKGKRNEPMKAAFWD